MAIVKRKSGRMVSSLPSISFAIWLMITVSLVVLSVVLALTRPSIRYPYFFVSIRFTTFSCSALFVFPLGPVLFGEGKTGPNQGSAGAYVHPSEDTGSLEDQLHKSHPGMEEEGLVRQSLRTGSLRICLTPIRYLMTFLPGCKVLNSFPCVKSSRL